MVATWVAEQYELTDVVRRGQEASIGRARRVRDGQIVLLEIPHTSSARARLDREHAITRTLDSRFVLWPVAASTFAGTPVLVFDDFTGMALAKLVSTPALDVGAALQAATALAASLESVHRAGIVHRDIKPENVFYDPRTCIAKLTGFGIASIEAGEHWAGGIVEGTPPYMSPEQTGRLDRPLDARTDLYSLGLVLYELFAGARPFEAHDLVGWIHCHIAQVPAPLGVVAPHVPRPVSDVVMRLLAKLPEERYQTAAGLLDDLRHCRDEWNASGAIAPFVIGRRDVSDRLRIPKKLYGRERETELLVRTLERVTSSGTPAVVLVGGPAGVGKSMLARSLEDLVARAGGIFAAGKFEARARHRPYSAIARALQEAVPYILSGRDEDLRAWQQQLAEAVGPIGQLVVDLIPALETIIGKQPPVPELPLSETQDRFYFVMRRFVAALAKRTSVLTLFLDDLHAADIASLDLLAHLVTHAETGRLLVIGAYRDDEVAPGHPMRALARELHDHDTVVADITLAPLPLSSVTDLCADALSSTAAVVAPLARVVWDRTGGNALAATQLVVALHRGGILVFDAEQRAWQWDLARASDAQMHADVAARTLARLHDVGPAVRGVLEVGACLGSRFDARTLALATPADEVHYGLAEAVAAGLLSASGDSYHFLHDRIHEAIYEAIPAGRRAELHARIGRLLLEHLSAGDLATRIFEVAGHFELGASVLADQTERDRIAALDLQAGTAAMASSAFAPAAKYLAAGVRLLAPQAWQQRHDLALGLHLTLARCELVMGRIDETQRLIAEIRQHVSVERGRAVDRLQIDLHLARSEPIAAVSVAFASLAGLGVELSLHPTREDLDAAERAVWRELADRPIEVEALGELPALADPEIESALEMLSAVLAPAYFADSKLHCLVACRMVALSVRHGVAGPSAMGCAAFAMELFEAFDRPTDARRFEEIAKRLVEKDAFLPYAGRTLMVLGSFAAARLDPFARALELLRAGREAALAVGDLAFAGYTSGQIVGARLARGDALDEVSREASTFVTHAGLGVAAAVLRIQVSFVHHLQARVPGSAGIELDEDTLLRAPLGGFPIIAVWFHICKLQARCIGGDHAGALEEAQRARPLLWATRGQIRVAEYHFFAALAHAAVAAAAPDEERARHLRELASHEEALRGWADGSPASYLHMHALVAAEGARLAGHTPEAMQLFEQAIHSAHDNEIKHGEALAYEHAASFYAELGLQGFADLYLREARQRYLEWGAHGKVRAIDERRPATSIATVTSEAMDPLGLLKLSQTMSSELVRSKLLGALTEILQKYAGARRAVFLSVRGDQWSIESVAGPDGGVPTSIVNHVFRSRERIVLHDATLPGPYSMDPYVTGSRPRSVLCLPVKRAELVGIVYLENDLVPGLFTDDRLAVLETLVEQAGISLENARLYADREREIAERQEAEATLRAILDNMPDAVLMCDRAAHITFANPAGMRLLGLEPGSRPFITEIPARLHRTHPDGTPFAIHELPVVRALSGEVVSGADMTLRDADTERVTHLRVSAAPLRDDTGSIAGAVAMFINVTEATELDRLKGQFLSVVAHELKTPITVVKGYADVLRRMDVPSAQHHLLDALVRGADRIDSLATNLLMVWQLQTGRLTLVIEDHVDLVGLVERVIRNLDPDAARRISVVADLHPTIAVDRQLVEKVISNLVDNALRYSPEGSPVSIDVRAVNACVAVTVTDHGVGIPRARQAHLFEPFVRAHTDTPYDFGGLGIGLYVVKAILGLHGGTIEVESKEGAGSAFRLALPLPV